MIRYEAMLGLVAGRRSQQHHTIGLRVCEVFPLIQLAQELDWFLHVKAENIFIQ